MRNPNTSFAPQEAMRNVGKLIKIIGVKQGIVSVWHDPFVFEQIPHREGDFIFVAIDGLCVPFQICRAEQRADGSTTFYFQELHDGITADELVGCELFLPENVLSEDEQKDDDDNFSLEWFVGCRLKDQNGTVIGEIVDYEQYSLSMLLVVGRENGEEVLVPFHPNLVLDMPSDDNNVLQLQIANGLLEGVE